MSAVGGGGDGANVDGSWSGSSFHLNPVTEIAPLRTWLWKKSNVKLKIVTIVMPTK